MRKGVPVVGLELDIDSCLRTYGDGVCRAGINRYIAFTAAEFLHGKSLVLRAANAGGDVTDSVQVQRNGVRVQITAVSFDIVGGILNVRQDGVVYQGTMQSQVGTTIQFEMGRQILANPTVEIWIELWTANRHLVFVTTRGATANAPENVDYPNACYNTFSTCQDRPNYSKGAAGFRFISEDVTAHGWLPMIPRRNGFSHRAAALKKDFKLWERERIIIRLSDSYLGDTRREDKYAIHRIAAAEGTWLSRLFARNVFFNRRPARVRIGIYDTESREVTWHTTHKLIIDRANYDNGVATFELNDGIKLRAQDGAQCPRPSDIKLAADINDTDITLQLTADFPQPLPAKISIGREIMDTQYALSDNRLRVTRATSGSERSSHEEGDTVQDCYVVTSQNCVSVVRDLLTNYADLGDMQIDEDGFSSEENGLLSTYNVTSVVARPTGVDRILDDLQQSCLFNIWHDSAAAGVVRLRSIVGLSVFLLPSERGAHFTDDDIVQDSCRVRSLPRDSVSDVLIFCEPVDYADTSANDSNYKVLSLARNSFIESDNARGERVTKRLFTRWANGAVAAAAARRYLLSGGENGGDIEFSVVVEAAGIEVGDNVRILTRRHCGVDGRAEEYIARVHRIETAADVQTKKIYGVRTVYGDSETSYFRISHSVLDGEDVLL